MPPSPVRLAFVGDIAFGDHPKTVGFGFHSRYPDAPAPALAGRLTPPGPPPDLYFGNLEFSLGARPGSMSTLAERQCRGSDRNAAWLRDAGITVLNVANNHSAQHGPEAFRATTGVLRRHGFAVAGTPSDFGEEAVLAVRGHRIACLAFSDRPRQHDNEPPPYNEFGDHAHRLIAGARTRADIVVVSMHWGEEFVHVPSARERVIARAIIDAGATIVIGHHPHVLREVEEYSHGLIAYSLGNFVGDMTWTAETRLGGCLTVEMDGGRISSHHLALSRIQDDYLPAFLTGSEANRVADHLARIRERQRIAIDRRGYDAVVDAEHRRHVMATGLMMARHVHRYPAGILLPMLGGAAGHRLRFWRASDESRPSRIG